MTGTIIRPKSVYLCSGFGQGYSQLEALDNALLEAGIGDLSLIAVTSILPPRFKVVQEMPADIRGCTVPCIISKAFGVRGDTISAAIVIARTYREDGSEDIGLVAEAHALGPENVAVEMAKEEIKRMAQRRGLKLEIVKVISASGIVEEAHGCAIACAVML